MTAPPSNSPPEESADDAAFERIDWDDFEPEDRGRPTERIVLVLGLVVLGGVVAYDRTAGGAYLVWRWSAGLADWLTLLSLVVVLACGVVPLLRNRDAARRVVGRLRLHRATAAGLGFLTGVVVFAAYAVLSGLQPRLTLDTGTEGPDRFQPPVGFDVPYIETRNDCVGPTTDEVVYERLCSGTWTYPLGTDRWGYEMTDLLLVGTRPVLYATLVTIGLIVPLATVVGLVAGYYGGLVDDLLMGYVDVQLSVPAILLYLVAWLFVGNSMGLLLIAFGLLSWGGIARIVRSETLQRREAGYVLSARSIGASDGYVLRRHLLPNVTNSVLPATAHLIAVLVLTEAGLSFLGFSVTFQSWGMTIAEGLYNGPPTQVWWNSTVPALALAGTVASLKIAGDGLRDVLDPRGDV